MANKITFVPLLGVVHRWLLGGQKGKGRLLTHAVLEDSNLLLWELESHRKDRRLSTPPPPPPDEPTIGGVGGGQAGYGRKGNINSKQCKIHLKKPPRTRNCFYFLKDKLLKMIYILYLWKNINKLWFGLNPKPCGYINFRCPAAWSYIWLLRRPIGEREALGHAPAVVRSSRPTLRKI